MPTSLGPAEILVILVVALIVLGPKRLPDAGRQVGRALAEVRKWSRDFQHDIRSVVDLDSKAPSYPSSPAGTTSSPIPLIPADTGAPTEPSTNGTRAITTGGHGPVSGPPPAEPPAGELPST